MENPLKSNMSWPWMSIFTYSSSNNFSSVLFSCNICCCCIKHCIYIYASMSAFVLLCLRVVCKRLVSSLQRMAYWLTYYYTVSWYTSLSFTHTAVAIRVHTNSAFFLPCKRSKIRDSSFDCLFLFLTCSLDFFSLPLCLYVWRVPLQQNGHLQLMMPVSGCKRLAVCDGKRDERKNSFTLEYSINADKSNMHTNRVFVKYLRAKQVAVW